jgi:hypothetical protein
VPTVFTLIARVKDWEALHKLNQDILIGQAAAAGATRYRVFRNVNDASEVMVLAELQDYEAAQEMGKALDGPMTTLLERIWEPTGWEEIGSKEAHPRQSSPLS